METIYTTTSATPKVLVTHNPNSKEILNYELVTKNLDGQDITDLWIDENNYKIYIKDGSYYYKAVFHDNVINLNNFIDRNYPDITKLLQFVIKMAYQLSQTTNGWKEPLKIKIPTGKFLVTDTLIDTSLDVNAGKFILEGEGYQNTIIKFEPNTEKFLFNNDKIFGYTTFSNIGFISNGSGKFMNAIGGGNGNAQSLLFTGCSFNYFKTILDVTGDTMMSEITFRDCKIKDAPENSVLFKLNNPQAVNWRFYSTDIENNFGIIFDFYAGSTISYYQGSIISKHTTEKIIFRVNNVADPNKFGSGNSPQLQINGVRFELRDNTKLIKIDNEDVEFSAKFDNCGMGGYNLDTSIYTIDIKGKGNFIFDNCTNYQNFKFKHQVRNADSYLHPAKIKFINTCPDLELINNGSCNEVFNTGGYPIYVFENCGLNSYYRPFGRDTFFLNNDYYKISKKIISKGSRNNGTIQEETSVVQDRVYADLGQNTVGYKHLVSFDLPNVPIHSIKIIFDKAWQGGYGGQTYNVKVLKTNTPDPIATGQLNTSNKLELTANTGYFLANNDKIHIQVETIEAWSQTLGIKVFLVVEY
ncbi:hypothetical protein [Chryseobacterium oryctis]|uniref:Uncharacterized protein n=1 Tax=Chryseobacterium oryctis TaxID=2952618 RepID=A0ABT3HLP4_9FLAO|nr:hypothetical protein [Chryseobacterium oryctis]MCW3160701.1 hypothetical protein [Chryseobacterium oryctis]